MSKLAPAIALVLLVALAEVAAGQLRDFLGTVVGKSAQELTVERAGEVRRFVRSEGVRVDGQRQDWDELRVGDTVVVGWSLTDETSTARRVNVVSRAPDR